MSGIDNELENELDLFDDDKDVIVEPIKEEILEPGDLFAEPKSSPENQSSPVMEELLKSKGIVDGKITMLGEDEKEEQISFYDLSKEEQLEILTAQETVEPAPDPIEFAEGEKEFLEQLRKEDISLKEYLTKYKEEAISEVDTNPSASYDIDAYDDEELFLLDLKSKYDLTDEELTKELEKELADKDLFTKKITKTREEYKELEDTYKKNEAEKFEADQEQQYGEFVETMVDVAVKTPEFYGIELDDDEKNEVLSFLLEMDDEGTTGFSKTLNTPGKLYEAAWFLKYGKEAFEALTNAYETEIKNLKEDKPKPKTKVVIKKDEVKDDEYGSIHDIF